MINYVSTKKEYLRDYIKGLTFLRKELITHNNKIIGSRVYYLDDKEEIEVSCYHEINNLYVLRTDSKQYRPIKGLVKASDLFDEFNILNGLVNVSNYTLEGTDGIGKSTVIESLLDEGIVCFDRNLDVICKYMLFDVPMEKRILEYKKYLETTKDKILFLVNMDEEELQKRINSRESITEFDKYAVEYNKLYYETYNVMQEKGYLNDKLFLLDCTGFSKEEQISSVKKMILR